MSDPQDPREKIEGAIGRVLRYCKHTDATEAAQILAHAAEALLKEHTKSEHDACCMVATHVHNRCPVLSEVVRGGK